jgi:hypothetical protein
MRLSELQTRGELSYNDLGRLQCCFESAIAHILLLTQVCEFRANFGSDSSLDATLEAQACWRLFAREGRDADIESIRLSKVDILLECPSTDPRFPVNVRD